MGIHRVSQGHQVFLARRMQRLTQSYDKVASTGHRGHPLRIQVLHELRRSLRIIVSRAQLADMVVTPAIHVPINC